MSLDDMIRAKPAQSAGKGKAASGRGATKTIGKAGAGRGGGRGGGGSPSVVKPSPGGRGVAVATLHSMAQRAGGLVSKSQRAASVGVGARAAGGAPVAGLTTGTKLRVGNLDLAVTQDDLKELFQEMGKTKSVELQTKADGLSRGHAFIVYARKADALKAIEQYNGVPLDGRPLKITLMGGGAMPNAAMSASSIAVAIGGNRQRDVYQRDVYVKPTHATGVFAKPTYATGVRPITGAKGRGKGRGGGGGGRGGGRGGAPPKAEDMDADLDAYMSR